MILADFVFCRAMVFTSLLETVVLLRLVPSAAGRPLLQMYFITAAAPYQSLADPGSGLRGSGLEKFANCKATGLILFLITLTLLMGMCTMISIRRSLYGDFKVYFSNVTCSGGFCDYMRNRKQFFGSIDSPSSVPSGSSNLSRIRMTA